MSKSILFGFAAMAVGVLISTPAVVAAELPIAPAPRAVTPDLSLIVVEEVVSDEGLVETRRILRIGFRNGVMLPAETIWEGKQRFLGHFGGHQLVDDRFLVTHYCGVIDLQTKKMISDEEDGQLCRVDGTRVIYRIENTRREEGIFSFDLTTRAVTFLDKLGEGKYGITGVLSPDSTKAIETGPVANELILHQAGTKQRLLGKGFHINVSPLSSTFGPTPVLWLDNNNLLNQRGNGKLVTVDLTGKTTEVVTIKDASKELVSAPHLFRDGSDRVSYSCGGEAFAIDLAKKSWSKYEWWDLGHGFDASWESHDKLGHKLRYRGKEIGWFWGLPHTAKTAPGYLALEARQGQELLSQPECVAIWSAASGEWSTLKLWPNCIVGWVK